MRVLVVTPWFPSSGLPGSGLFNQRDVELLARDHEVTVLHLIGPQLLEPGESRETTVPGGTLRVIRQPFSLMRPMTLLRARSAVRREGRHAELVHTMAFPALLPSKLAGLRLPWVHTEHYSALVSPPSSVWMEALLRALKRLFKYPDETVAVSASLARVIDQYRSVSSTVIGNEVMGPVQAVPERGRFDDRIRLIGVGGIVARKGPVQAVETLAELLARGIDARLTWVGDGDLRDEMLAVARRRGVSDRLNLTGQLQPDELSRELLMNDLFLLPVEAETFGVALAEALAHGLPVVATGTGGHEEFLPHGASRLVAHRDAPQLADAVQEIMGDPELWSRDAIARYARERFSRDRRREEYLRVYSQAARPRSRRG